MAKADSKLDWDRYLDEIVQNWRRDSDRKQERSIRREKEILSAALRVFARDGISRSKIGDIAAEAGMSTSTLYEYFPSKEDIAHVVPINHWTHFYEEYAEAARTLESSYDRLYKFLWLNADFARRNQEWARVFYLEIWPSVAVADSELRSNIDDFARVVIALLKEGKATGEFSELENPYEVSAILIGSISQITTTWLLYRRPKNLSKAAESLLNNIMPKLLKS